MAREDLNALDVSAASLEESLGGAAAMAASFDTELTRMRGAVAATEKDVKTLEHGLSKGLRRAFDGLVFDGIKLSDALENIAKSMINTTYSAALKPVTNHVSGVLTDGLTNLIGGWLGPASAPSASAQAKGSFGAGGSVARVAESRASSPATMPAAPSPAARSHAPQPRSAPVSVVMHVQTPDVQGFQRSQNQIAAQMSRALARGNRNA